MTDYFRAKVLGQRRIKKQSDFDPEIYRNSPADFGLHRKSPTIRKNVAFLFYVSRKNGFGKYGWC